MIVDRLHELKSIRIINNDESNDALNNSLVLTLLQRYLHVRTIRLNSVHYSRRPKMMLKYLLTIEYDTVLDVNLK